MKPMASVIDRVRASFATLSVPERKALVYTAFAAAIFLLLPGEWVSGSFTLMLAWVLYRLNVELFPKKGKGDAKADEAPADAKADEAPADAK